MYEQMTQLCAPNIATGKHTLSNGVTGGRMSSNLDDQTPEGTQDRSSFSGDLQDWDLDVTQVFSTAQPSRPSALTNHTHRISLLNIFLFCEVLDLGTQLHCPALAPHSHPLWLEVPPPHLLLLDRITAA
jgi:hypothetical protein